MGELSQMQKIELEMLKEVQAICARHAIPYFVLGGTLLGAVRHQGFIPWDDDIDIGIPRQHYDRFIVLAKEELPLHLVAKTYRDERGDAHPMFICIVKDMNTRIDLHHANEVEHTSVWLDVFPLDGLSAVKPIRYLQMYRRLYDRMKIQFSMYEQNVHQHRSGRPLYERMLMRFREVTGFGADWDTYELMCKAERTLKKHPYEAGGYCVNMYGAYKFKDVYPVDWFGDGIELPFEDTTVVCPVEYDKFLRQVYGDYLQPPSKEERANQHCMEVISLGEDGEVDA